MAARTGPSGEFRFERLPRREWQLTAQGRRLRSQGQRVTLGTSDVEGVQLNLQRTVRVAERVVATGAPVTPGDMRISVQGIETKSAECDDDGSFALDPLLPGTYALDLSVRGANHGTLEIRWHDALQLTSAQSEPPPLELRFTARKLGLLDEQARAAKQPDLAAWLAAQQQAHAEAVRRPSDSKR